MSNPFKRCDLPFEPNALEPYISKTTVELHYDKHHKTYVDKLNELVVGTKYADMSLPEVVKSAYEDKNMPIFNNAGQALNHDLYWQSISSNPIMPNEELLNKIKDNFGSFEELKNKLTEAAITQFGSGWAWLVYDIHTKKLEVLKTSNAESPLLNDKKPLIALDVWEHAYYLDYKNKRVDYVKAFIDNLINWNLSWSQISK